VLRRCVFIPSILLSITLGSAFVAAEDWSPLWSKTTLSQARWQLTGAAAGGKVFFAGGDDNSGESDLVDVYDINSDTWSQKHLSQRRLMLAATSLGNKVYFGGGCPTSGPASDVVDVYDTSANTWSTATLSKARCAFAAAACGSKVVFGGGNMNVSPYNTNAVDIYDSTSNRWSTAALSVAPQFNAAAAAGSKIVFFGGNCSGHENTTADIYDLTTNAWSTATRPVGRELLAATSANGKIFFGGGQSGTSVVSAVDVYDASSGSWSTAQLSEARGRLAAATVGSKVIFAGGAAGSYPFTQSNVVDIYDTITNTWSTASLSQPRDNLVAAAAGNKAFFAGGLATGNKLSNVVDIYTSQNYGTITSAKAFSLVDQTTVAGRMQLNSGASLNLNGFDLTVGSMGGAAPINVSSRTLTIGTDNTDCEYAGTVSGNGMLVKTGSGLLTLLGANSYSGSTTISAGKLDLVGPDAWKPVLDLGGAYLSGGELVFDYAAASDPYSRIQSLLGTKINGSAPLLLADDTAYHRLTISLAVPEPSTFVLLGVAAISLLACVWRRRV
jgi:autotransporter-associated beta strand protein